jgi:hypothetical protein
MVLVSERASLNKLQVIIESVFKFFLIYSLVSKFPSFFHFTENNACILICPTRATYSAHRILHIIVLILFYDEYKLWISSLFSFHHHNTCTSSHLRSLQTFSSTSLLPLLTNMRVSRPCRTGKVKANLECQSLSNTSLVLSLAAAICNAHKWSYLST